MRRALILLVICVTFYGISQEPHRWADTVERLGDRAGVMLSGFGTFITDVVT